MRSFRKILFVAVLLFTAWNQCLAAIAIEGRSKEWIEKELGVSVKSVLIGTTNEIGIAIEFAPKDKLEGFLFVMLNIYLELPKPNSGTVTSWRRLTSVTLQPRIQTKENVALFFTVDPDFVDRSEITIRVHSPDGRSPDGYRIRLRDFVEPKANKRGAVKGGVPY